MEDSANVVKVLLGLALLCLVLKTDRSRHKIPAVLATSVVASLALFFQDDSLKLLKKGRRTIARLGALRQGSTSVRLLVSAAALPPSTRREGTSTKEADIAAVDTAVFPQSPARPDFLPPRLLEDPIRKGHFGICCHRRERNYKVHVKATKNNVLGKSQQQMSSLVNIQANSLVPEASAETLTEAPKALKTGRATITDASVDVSKPSADTPSQRAAPFFGGRWRCCCVDSVGFDALLKERGVGWLKRLLFKHVNYGVRNVWMDIKQTGDYFEIKRTTGDIKEPPVQQYFVGQGVQLTSNFSDATPVKIDPYWTDGHSLENRICNPKGRFMATLRRFSVEDDELVVEDVFSTGTSYKWHFSKVDI